MIAWQQIVTKLLSHGGRIKLLENNGIMIS
jgi:hypothetical protein